ncbi:MAG: protein kinase domain-containing protein [Nannocystaceae bacterium]|nr:serine/threonine-protein kinase [bacterium]
MSSQDELETVQGNDANLADTVAGESGSVPIDASGIRRGESVGRYIVLERLGAGAMGVVLAAYDPELDRKVAIKVLRGSGRDIDSRGARLLREAKALARLVHPNVVSVFDVGTHEKSVFVAMEYIEGTTLLETMQRWHEDPPRWTTIVETFLRAGRGLAAAHDAGIVHRDFKPANVMVAHDERVIVLDFGLAQEGELEATSSDGRTRSGGSDVRLTQTGTLLGTPAYMSPEQLRRDVVGPASDQFSFCVALYEALCGVRPFPAKSLRELVDTVLTRRVETVDARDDIPEHVREALLRGLALDPQDRFATMHDLLAALRPAPARRGIPRWAFAATAAVAAASVAGASWWRTRKEAVDCSRVGNAALAVWGPEQAEQLRARFEALEGSFGVEAAGIVTGHLDDYAQRWSEGRTAACRANADGSTDEITHLAQTLCYERSLAALEGWVSLVLTADGTLVQRAAASATRLPRLTRCASKDVELHRLPFLEDPDQRVRWLAIDGKFERALASAELGQMQAVEPLIRDGLDEARAMGAAGLESRGLIQLSRYLINTGGDESEALAAAREAVLRAEVSGEDERLINALRNVAFIAGVHAADEKEASASLDRLDAVIARAGDDPRLRKVALSLRARTKQRARRWEEALEIFREAAAMIETEGVPPTDDDISTLAQMVTTASHLGHLDEAEAAARRALQLSAELLGESHPRRAMVETAFGSVEALRGNPAEAAAAYRRAEAIMLKRLPPGHRNLPAVRNELGKALRAQGRLGEALATFERALAQMIEASGPRHPDVASIHTNLGLLLADLERLDEAREHLRDALDIRLAHSGPDASATFYAAINLGEILVAQGALDEAEGLYARADRWRQAAGGDDDPLRSEVLKGRGEIALARGAFDDAIDLLTRALTKLPEDTEAFIRAQTHFSLAKAQWGAGQHDTARTSAAAGIELWRDDPRAATTGLPEAQAWLANRAK